MTAEDRSGKPNDIYPGGLNLHARFQLRETEYDGISYLCPTWDQMGVFNFDLARQIIQSGQSFDRLIALARGGWTWARDLADALKIPELSSVRIVSYTGVNESNEPRIVQPLTDSISGEKILLFDEVIDSGVTIKKAQEYLKVMGAQDIQTGALCYKTRSKVKPDFFAFTTKAWVVFPHEIREFVEGSLDNWRLKGLSIEVIKDRLITLGVPSDQVEFYCSLNVK
jgi:hypoxanthine phosphoribosyltransferase